jgi:hypothetical protein
VKRFCISSLILLVLLTGCNRLPSVTENGVAQPLFTQCQWQDNPGNISNALATFSWKTEGQQSSYQILVASDLSKLKANKGDLWDSGKISSKKHEGVSYKGENLKRNTIYYWKVRTWAGDVASEYSGPTSFKMSDHLISILSPKGVVAGSWETIIFKIEMGDAGLSIGDGFSIPASMKGNHFLWMIDRLAWSPWQISDPKGAGYTTVKTSREGAVVVPEVVGQRGVLNLTVTGKNLQPGDIVTVTYGDKTGGSQGVKIPGMALRYFFPLCKHNDAGDTWGVQAWEKYKDAPSIEIFGNKATKFNVVANPLQEVGEKFKLKVMAIDETGNLDVNYRGTVSFQSSDSLAELPSEYTFTAFDGGMHSFEAALKSEGLNTIAVSGEDITGKSNVIDVSSGENDSNIFFGDFHGHTWFSDGLVWIDDHYLYARDAAGLDFAGVTDHAEDPFNVPKEYVLPYANRFHESGDFVTLYSYEWTRGGGYGHINPLFLHESEFDVFKSSDYTTADKLWEALKGREVIAPPHHTATQVDLGAAGFDWDHYNEEFLKTVEIASQHGISECMGKDGNPYPLRAGMDPNRTVQYALGEKGYKLGIIGSSDAHGTRLGELWHPWQEGYEGCALTAVYSKELTREAIYNAIKNRNTYATTGERFLIEFSINGHPMGSEFELAEGEKPDIELQVGGTNKIKDVVVWKYSLAKGWEKALVVEGDSEIVSTRYADKDFDQDSLYYLRVTQEGSPLELAWTSPIWVDIQK